MAFGSQTRFPNRVGLDTAAQERWEKHSAIRSKEFNRDARVDLLSFLGEKARAEMPMKWQVKAKWATEIVVRIADDCTTGAAQARLQECYVIDMDQAGTLGMFKPINPKKPNLVGLPPIPLEDRVKPKPVLHHRQTEKAVDRALREELEWRNKQEKREKDLRNRRKEIRKVLRAKKKEKRQQQEAARRQKKDLEAASEATAAARKEAERLKKEHIKIEIANYKARRAAKLAEEAAKKDFQQDASTRHYQMRFKSYPKQTDVTKVNQKFDMEELNKRRSEAQKARRASMANVKRMQAKEKEEADRVEEQIRQADHPLDKLSLKLHYELRKNMKKLSDIFALMDTDGSGTVTYKELRAGLFRVGIKLNTKEAQTLCEGLDKDGDGEIAYNELARFLAATKGGEESAAMVIQARLRANKVNTKTLAQKKEEFERKKQEEQNARLAADRAAWDKKQKKMEQDLEDESLAFGVARKGSSLSMGNEDEMDDNKEDAEQASRKQAEEEEQERKQAEAEEEEARKKAEEEAEAEAARKKAEEEEAEAARKKAEEEEAARKQAEEEEEDPFGMSDDEEVAAAAEGAGGEEDTEEASPAQIANWDTE